MTRLRILLILMTGVMAATTGAVMLREGVDFLTPFISAVLVLGWQGQFNLDFACYLILSALWIAWRAGFAPGACAIAALAALLGMLVFAPYVLVQIAKSRGGLAALLLGVHARSG